MKQFLLSILIICSFSISSCTSEKHQIQPESTNILSGNLTPTEKTGQNPSQIILSTKTPGPIITKTRSLTGTIDNSIPSGGNWEISPETAGDISLLHEVSSPLPGSIHFITWSPDREVLAVAGKQGLILLDGGDLSTKFTLDHEKSYYHLAFSPRGEILAASRYPDIVDVWDMNSKILVSSLENSGNKSFFSPTGTELAIVLDDLEDNDSVGAAKTYIKLYETKTWKQMITLTTITNTPYWTMQFPETIGVFFSQDGEKIQAVNILGDVRMWNSKTGALLNSSINNHTRERLENGICFTSPSMSSEFALNCMISYLDPPCNEDVPGCNPIGKLRYDIGIWDTDQLKRNRNLIIYEPPGYLVSTVYDPKTKMLVLNENEQIFILDLTKNIKQISTRKELEEKTKVIRLENCIDCPYGLMDMTWKENQPFLALAKNGHIEVWNLSVSRQIASITDNTNFLTTFDSGVWKGNPAVALGYSDGKVQVVDLKAGLVKVEITVGNKNIRDLVLSPNGEFLFSVENDYNLKKWDLETRELEAGFPIELVNPKIISNSDKNLIAYTIYDSSIGKNQLILADMNTNKIVRKIQTTFDEIAFSQDGNWIATMDRMINLWDVNFGNLLREFPLLAPSYEKTLVLSQDASFIGLAQDNTFKIWDVNTNATYIHEAVTGDATSIIFSPSVCMVALGDSSGRVTILDLTTKEILTSWQAHGSEIQELQFSQDGRELISQSNLGTVRFWGQPGVLALPAGTPAEISCHNALPPQTSTPITPTAPFTPVAPTDTPTMATFFRILTLTEPPMQGTDVLQMQQRLYALGYIEVGIPDGVFGKKTDQAVRNFQEKNGLVVDGIVGPITWNKLFSS